MNPLFSWKIYEPPRNIRGFKNPRHKLEYNEEFYTAVGKKSGNLADKPEEITKSAKKAS